jgi:hypothetical protein
LAQPDHGAGPLCWPLYWFTTGTGVRGKVPNFPIVVAGVPNWRGLLWWPGCSLLLQSRSEDVMLLLLLEL